MRLQKPKKDYAIPVLIVVNLVVFVTVIFLWTNQADEMPSVATDFSTDVLVHIPLQVSDNAFNDAAVIGLDGVGIDLRSQHALLINLDSGEIIFDHRGRERAFPASVTKIMTVLVGIEHSQSDVVAINANFTALAEAQAAMVGFVFGEERSIDDVLFGSMLASGADATTSLAYHVSGSYQGFVNLMNETAWRIGMNDTHFMNASGLHHEEHYTTAYDIALLLEYALTIPRFREIFTTQNYSFINFSGYEQTLESIMFRNMPSPYFLGGQILGGMTGFTTPAGLCLASLATNGEEEFALITFGAPSGGLSYHVLDAFLVYEYFFN